MKECPACHAFNHDEAKFCAVCGVSLVPLEELPPPPAPASKEENAPDGAPMPAANAESAPPAVLVRNDSPMTPATMKEFYKLILISGFVLLVCGALLILLAVFLMSLDEDEGVDLLVFIYCGIIIAVCGGVYIGLYYGPYTHNKLFSDTTHALYICDDRGLVQYMYDENGKTGEQFIGYAQISKVTGRKNFLVIRFSMVAWIVDRRTFTMGTEADFLNLLRSHGVNVKVKAK